MSDGLRAKFTLELDDRLTAAARRALGGFARDTEEVAKSSGRGRDALGRFNKGLGDAGRGADRAEDEVDDLAAAVRKLNKDLNKTGAGKAFEFAANLKHSADNLESFSRQAGSLIKGPIDKFTAFEEQMDSVEAATFDLTKAMNPAEAKAMEAAVGKLSATARKLGSDTKYSATEAAAGMDILAKNFSGTDMQKAADIVAAMPGILDTAAAVKESIESTSDISTAAMNPFGLAAKDMGLIGDILVKTANGSATGLIDIGEALKYSGVSARNAGLDLATTAGIIGALGNAGKKGSTAGTGLASVLGNMQSGMKKQKSALKALGIDVTDKNGNLRPIVDLFAEIDRAADRKFGKGKGGVKRDRWLQGLVGMGSDKESLAILTRQAGTGELQALIAANQNAAGTAHAVATKMNANTAGAGKELNSTFEELQLTIGERVIPDVVALIKWTREITLAITDWTRAHPDLTRNIGLVLAGLAGFGLVVAPVLRGVGAAITVYGGLSSALSFGATAFKALRLAALANPVTAIILGIAGAAALIYTYWDDLPAFFTGLWEGIKTTFDFSLEGIVGKLDWVKNTIFGMKNEVEQIMKATADLEETKAKSSLFKEEDDSFSVHSRMVTPNEEAEFRAIAATTAQEAAAGRGMRGDAGDGGTGRGELLVKVSDDRVRVETRDGDLPYGLRAARGSST